MTDIRTPLTIVCILPCVQTNDNEDDDNDEEEEEDGIRAPPT